MSGPTEDPSLSGGQQPHGQPHAPSHTAPQFQPSKPTNTNAIISLILGLASFITGLMYITGIPAIIFGHKAKRELAANPGAQEGEGLATAGIVCGWIATILSALIVVFVVIVIVFSIGIGVAGLSSQ